MGMIYCCLFRGVGGGGGGGGGTQWYSFFCTHQLGLALVNFLKLLKDDSTKNLKKCTVFDILSLAKQENYKYR